MDMSSHSGGFYMQYLESLCRRRGWLDPMYECRRGSDGFSCLVLVNGREYQTDLTYQSDFLAQENAAMRAFMVCRNFSVNGGMLARNGIVQGLPAGNDAIAPSAKGLRKSRHPSSSPTQPVHWDGTHDSPPRHNRSGSNSTASCDGE
jgi:hypothetical protein